jgi:hypothetical protein
MSGTMYGSPYGNPYGGSMINPQMLQLLMQHLGANPLQQGANSPLQFLMPAHGAPQQMPFQPPPITPSAPQQAPGNPLAQFANPQTLQQLLHGMVNGGNGPANLTGGNAANPINNLFNGYTLGGLPMQGTLNALTAQANTNIANGGPF